MQTMLFPGLYFNISLICVLIIQRNPIELIRMYLLLYIGTNKKYTLYNKADSWPLLNH